MRLQCLPRFQTNKNAALKGTQAGSPHRFHFMLSLGIATLGAGPEDRLKKLGVTPARWVIAN